MTPMLCRKIIAMSVVGCEAPVSPDLVFSRSNSSHGMSTATSEEPRSISAMRVAASVANLKTTVSKAGAPPQ